MGSDTIFVVIPAHNAGDQLEQCLESVTGQTLRDLEIICVGDGSTDRSPRIAIVPETLVHHRVNRRASASNTRSLQPRAPYLAARAAGDFMARGGLWERYGQSDLSWAMEFPVWHVADLEDRDARRRCYRELREEWLPAFPFEEHPASRYENRAVYLKYRLARRAPWPVFAAALRAYRFLKRGGRHGH